MANIEDCSQLDISIQEKDKLVGEVIRYTLLKTHQSSGCPIKREELTQIITKNYRQRALPALVINEAREKLANIFGYEMKELNRLRPSSNRSTRASQQKNFWHQLRRLGINENDENHAEFGNNKQTLDMLVQQRYLHKEKVAGPEGNTMMYELAERSLDESISSKVKEYISQVVSKGETTEVDD